MAALPEKVRQAWADRDGPAILATVDADGTPNIIFASAVGMSGDDRIVVADNYFDKTRKKITQPAHGSQFVFGGGATQRADLQFHHDLRYAALPGRVCPPRFVCGSARPAGGKRGVVGPSQACQGG